jgi:hypothetical protein
MDGWPIRLMRRERRIQLLALFIAWWQGIRVPSYALAKLFPNCVSSNNTYKRQK